MTGQWAKKAYQEACKYGTANKIATSEDKTFSYIPDCSDLPVSEDADYVYICENNTIYGTKFKRTPEYEREGSDRRCIFLLLIGTCGCIKICNDLRRGAEKYRSGGHGDRNHP